MSTISKLNSILSDKIGRQLRRIILNPIERHRLRSSDFSILSQNCVGSIWYHDLGLRFTSPTINMKFDGNSWVEFIEDYDNLVNAPIEFIETTKQYPVGLIDGRIYVEFVHYHSQHDVRVKWDDRKKRIMPAKIVLGFDEGMSDTHIFRFLNLNKYPNRLLFVERVRAARLGINLHPHVIPVCKEVSGAKLLNFANIWGQRYYNRYIDYVDYINEAVTNDNK